MEQNERTYGTVVTFYSYKGGTGRSVALANMACLLGRSDAGGTPQVLAMDWDLEAPGLHYYFSPYVEGARDNSRPGVVDYFYRLLALLEEDEGFYETLQGPEGWKALDGAVPLDDYVVRSEALGVDLIKAGRFDVDYAQPATAFDWAAFYARYPEVIRVFRELITSKYQHCLIDSRTGLSDISGICTMVLPERLVVVFTANHQSLNGAIDVARRAVEFRRRSDDFRPLLVFPVPSRVDQSEQELRREARDLYKAAFEELFREAYRGRRCDLAAHFRAVQIPHVGYYSYRERIAVLDEEPGDRLSMREAYTEMYNRFVNYQMPCEELGPEDEEPTASGGAAQESPAGRGKQLWEKVLSATDAQRQVGNPTGDIRLTQAGWKDEEGRPIDQTTYFREQVFRGFDWSPKDEKVEEAVVPFDVTIFGINLGVKDLVVSHKPSGEGGQRNYTTGIQWGELAPVTRQADLAGKLLRLYGPPSGKTKPFFLEITAGE